MPPPVRRPVPRRRWLVGAIGLLLLGVPGTVLAARIGLRLGPPHVTSRSQAVVDPALLAELDAEVAARQPKTVDAAVEVALDVTGRSLRFGLDHRRSLRFGRQVREAHCIEYAHLAAHLLERTLRLVGLRGQARVVHSARASVWGWQLPWRGWRDHDWVLLDAHERDGRPVRRLLDPTLHDAGLHAGLEGAVQGRLP